MIENSLEHLSFNLYVLGKGSGLFGSITSSDLPSVASAAPTTLPPPASAGAHAAIQVPSTSAFIDIPLTSMRSTIAKRLLQSKQSVPHYYLTIEANVDKLLAARAHYNKKLEKSGIKLSVNDFIIKAVANSCRKVSPNVYILKVIWKPIYKMIQP